MASVGTTSPVPQYGVPAGGTAGQVLIKNSDDPYDTGWGSVASGAAGAIYVPGSWYDNRIAQLPLASSSTVNIELSKPLYVPVFVAGSLVVDALGCWNLTAQTAGLQMAIYSCNANGYPGSLLVSSPTVSTGATVGAKTFSIATTTLSSVNGWFWLSILRVSGSSISVSGLPADATRGPRGSINGKPPSSGSAEPYVSSSSAAFTNNPTISSTTSSFAPNLYFRIV